MTTQRIGSNRIADNAITASKLAPGAVPSGAPSHVANSAAIYANGAFVRANNSLNSNTGGTINGDLNVSGNLTVLGNTFTINAGTLVANDTVFLLGTGNYTSDLLDIGFAAHYNDGANAHTGFIRDHGTKQWQLFEGYIPEINANNDIIINDPSFKIANLRANLITDALTVRGIDPLTRANSAYHHANSSFNKANIATVMFVAVSDETTAITTGAAKVTFRAPYAMTVTNVRASLATTSSSGNVSLTIKENGTSILNGRVWITAGQKTSTTSTTIPSIADGAIADDAEITIDIDDAGSGAKGLKVAMIYTV